MNTTDCFSAPLVAELLRLGKLDRNWMTWHKTGKLIDGFEEYRINISQDTWLRKLPRSGADGFAMLSISMWLADGPKTFRPTVQQCESMDQIEIRLRLQDYEQPYSALMIELPPDRYAPYTNVLCYRDKALLVCVISSIDHKNDITTTVTDDPGQSDLHIEYALNKFDGSISEETQVATKAMRVALNSCLCLMEWGCKKLPVSKQIENDRKLAQENSERGARARDRLKANVREIAFDREVALHDVSAHYGTPGEPTGREMPFHSRRGHWAMVACGKGHSERKRKLRRPCLVRADKIIGEPSNYSTTYKG